MAAESEQEFAFEKNGSLFNWVAFDQNGMDDEVLKQTYKFGTGWYLKERDPSLMSSLFMFNPPNQQVV